MKENEIVRERGEKKSSFCVNCFVTIQVLTVDNKFVMHKIYRTRERKFNFVSQI